MSAHMEAMAKTAVRRGAEMADFTTMTKAPSDSPWIRKLYGPSHAGRDLTRGEPPEAHGRRPRGPPPPVEARPPVNPYIGSNPSKPTLEWEVGIEGIG